MLLLCQVLFFSIPSQKIGFCGYFRDHAGEPVPEENFWTLWSKWTLWCKGRLTETDTLNIRLGGTPSRLTSAHIHDPLIFLQAGCPSCRPTNSVKALKATNTCVNIILIIEVQWFAFRALTLLVGHHEDCPTCKKIEYWGAGMAICLERGASGLHMVQLLPLPPHRLLLH